MYCGVWLGMADAILLVRTAEIIQSANGPEPVNETGKSGPNQ